jgi:P27 family predicted phage terminase small subunit
MATGRPAGRPAKPTEQHRAAGNPSKKKLPAAPLPGEGLPSVAGIPTPPSLGEDGQRMWATVWSAGRAWLSPDSDYTIVKMLCEAHDEHELIRRQIATGVVERFYVTANGQMVTHPLVTQLGALRAQMTAWMSAIGFTPSDRARLGLAEVRVRDELDELTRRRSERAATA